MKISIKLPNGQVESKNFNKTLVTIGRATKNDFVVPDESLSRHHCQIEIELGEFYVTDLGSSNGVYLDGTRIAPGVRTPFTTFMPLSIGPLETEISDSDPDTIRVSSSPSAGPGKGKLDAPAGIDSTPTKPQRKINPSALNKDFKDVKVKDGKKKEASNPGLLIMIVLIVGGALYFQFGPTDEEQSGDTGPTTAVVKPVEKIPEDSFMASNEYAELGRSMSCAPNPNVCGELKLTPTNGEGLAQKDKEVFIFYKPSEHMNLPFLTDALRQLSDVHDLVAVFSLLNSNLFLKFEQKLYTQIHLVLLRPEGQAYRIYRFHTTKFNKTQRIDLLSDLGRVIESGETKLFWENLGAVTAIRDL